MAVSVDGCVACGECFCAWVLLGDLGVSCRQGFRAGEPQASSPFLHQRNLDRECFLSHLCHQL